MRNFSTQCGTPQPCTIPPEYSCMWSEVVQGYRKLYERYDHVVTKRKKIWELAQPKHKKLKCRPESEGSCKTKFNIEIVDKTDRMKSTRTEQLAYPKLRQLTHLKGHPSFGSFDDVRKSGVNRLIRKSLLSVYSRLQNVTLGEKPPLAKTWSAESKAKLTKRLQTLALPKKPHTKEVSRVKPNSGDRPKMRRIRKLSKPRLRKEAEPNTWVLTDSLRQYKASQRLIRISQPKKIEQMMYDEMDAPPLIRQNALKYKASRRIKALAEPALIRAKPEENPENPFKSNVRAQKAVASKRVAELAAPKDYTEMNIRADAFRVSRQALKAKASARLNELAVPKKR